ncbi:MAG: FtsW/RodA/SpoVE family cell cycle protein [Erysipelotrichales bacterium]|nr:FtsW/RodA/SpoVE family cell cycle protein [Erysipelotrichales bacterium]
MTLPFISYGGSSLVLMMLCMGVIMSVNRKSL